MFSRSGSQLSTMRVTRQIVLTLLIKRSMSLAVFLKKFGHFQNFGSNNAANLLSCPETILHVNDVKEIMVSFCLAIKIVLMLQLKFKSYTDSSAHGSIHILQSEKHCIFACCFFLPHFAYHCFLMFCTNTPRLKIRGYKLVHMFWKTNFHVSVSYVYQPTLDLFVVVSKGQ